MGFFPLVDQLSWADDLDVVADDCYTDPADPSAPARAALTHDLTRGVGGGRPWALLEQAAGAVSWRPHNLPKPPGAMLRDSLRAVAHGADAVCYFQWRASAHGLRALPLGDAPARRTGHRPAPGRPRAGPGCWPACGRSSAPAVDARVALVFDWPSLWAAEADSLPSTPPARAGPAGGVPRAVLAGRDRDRRGAAGRRPRPVRPGGRARSCTWCPTPTRRTSPAWPSAAGPCWSGRSAGSPTRTSASARAGSRCRGPTCSGCRARSTGRCRPPGCRSTRRGTARSPRPSGPST